MKKPFCMRVCTAARRYATAGIAGETRHPARSGLSLKFKVWEPEAVSRDPVHAARRRPIRPQLIWADDVFVSRRRTD